MLVLIGIGFVAGVITGVSPCGLPVLSLRDAVLELRFSPGVNAYAFTFG